jgi:hypothetical protein
MHEICFEVEGFPPAKSEALSMLGRGHPHAPRVLRLLEAAQRAIHGTSFRQLTGPIGLEVTLHAPPDQDPWDATNYLGGIADVLEDKRRRSTLALDHLGVLRDVALYRNDRQIREVHYRQVVGSTARYQVRIWSIDSPQVQS